MTESELGEIIRHSADQAEELFGKTWAWWKRILIIGAAILILGNTVLSTWDNFRLNATVSCQHRQGQLTTALRNQKNATIDKWVNDLSDQIKKGTLTKDSIEGLRVDYNTNSTAIQNQIDKIQSKGC